MKSNWRSYSSVGTSSGLSITLHHELVEEDHHCAFFILKPKKYEQKLRYRYKYHNWFFWCCWLSGQFVENSCNFGGISRCNILVRNCCSMYRMMWTYRLQPLWQADTLKLDAIMENYARIRTVGRGAYGYVWTSAISFLSGDNRTLISRSWFVLTRVHLAHILALSER